MELEPVSLSYLGGFVVALLVKLCEFMQYLLTCRSGFNNHACCCFLNALERVFANIGIEHNMVSGGILSFYT